MTSSYSGGCPSAGADQASRIVLAGEALIGVSGARDAAGAGSRCPAEEHEEDMGPDPTW